MNRRSFFISIAAIIGLPSVLVFAEWRRKRDIAAILKLKEELSMRIKKANEELKQLIKIRKKLSECQEKFQKTNEPIS